MEGLIILAGVVLAIILAYAMQTPDLLRGRDHRR